MTYKRSILLLVWSFSVVTVFSQTFTGTVIDQETNQPVPFANVYFVEIETGTITNQVGKVQYENAIVQQIN